MLLGLLTGSVAAILAALLSLPLRSPDDAFFNTASVTIGALLVGLVAGILRARLRARLPARTFALIWGAAFVAVLAGLVAGETFLQRMIEFGVPLALVIFAVTGGLTSYLTDHPLGLPTVAPFGAAAVAIALGLGLAGQGDAASGRLELPSAPTAQAARPTVAAPAGSTAVGSAAAGTATPAASPAAPAARFTKQADLKGVTFVVGQGSQATFTVNEKIAQFPAPNDAVMRTTALSGEVNLDGRPSTARLDLAKLSSDQSRRDDFIQQALFRTGTTATLTIASLPDLPATYTPGQVVKSTVKCTLNINGGDRPISFDVEARIDGATLNVVGRTSFVWSDFGYRAPNTPTVSVQDKVAVEVLIVATAP